MLKSNVYNGISNINAIIIVAVIIIITSNGGAI